MFKSAENNLCSPPNEQQSLCSILKQSFKFMISPVFVVQLSTFMFSNISMHLMLNVVNDLMMRSDNIMQNETSFETIQQQFDLSRGALGIVLPPLCGLINEASSACFQFCVENYFNFEFFSLHFLNFFNHLSTFSIQERKKIFNQFLLY